MKRQQMNKFPRTIEMRAAAPQSLEIELQGESTITVVEAKEGQKNRPPTFEMTVYAGGPITPHLDPPLKHPIVIDLAGLDLKRQRIPALKDHDSKKLVGHTESLSSDGKKLESSGVISGAGTDAQEVVMAAGNGFTWPISLGATLGKIELIKAGQTASVNGRTVTGPVYIARAGRPREVSFLTIAADDDAAASIAASAAKGNAMTFDEWLKLKKLQRERLSEAQLVTLQAAYDAEQKHGEEAEIKKFIDATVTQVAAELKRDPKKPVKRSAAAIKAAAAALNDDDDDDDDEDGNGETSSDLSEIRSRLDAMDRKQAIHRLCGDKYPEIAAKAMEKDWDDDAIANAIEAADLRAQLPNSLQIKTKRAKDAPSDGAVLEAACAISGNLGDIEEKFDEKVLNEASARFHNGISLQELLLLAAHANGYTGNNVRQDVRGVLEAAFPVRMRGAHFSTISLPGIFANTANKFMLDGFGFVEQAWREIAARRPVNDFKSITSYRMTGDATFEEVAADGEIKHGTLGEESFANRAKSFGKMYGITFQDIRNDDLGVLTSLPRKLGRGGAIKLNKEFWTKFMDNATFFADPSQNYLKGATSNLGAVGLGLAYNKFLAKVDADSEPLSVEPAILLVPAALATTAAELMTSSGFNTGGAATDAKVPNKNIWANKFKIVVSRYLGNAAFTGNSDLAYYLLPDPQDWPVIEVVFLDGKETPTVETADADFNTLGVQMRGTFHFGVAQQDARGSLKVKGAA